MFVLYVDIDYCKICCNNFCFLSEGIFFKMDELKKEIWEKKKKICVKENIF